MQKRSTVVKLATSVFSANTRLLRISHFPSASQFNINKTNCTTTRVFHFVTKWTNHSAILKFSSDSGESSVKYGGDRYKFFEVIENSHRTHKSLIKSRSKQQFCPESPMDRRNPLAEPKKWESPKRTPQSPIVSSEDRQSDDRQTFTMWDRIRLPNGIRESRLGQRSRLDRF